MGLTPCKLILIGAVWYYLRFGLRVWRGDRGDWL